MFGLSQLQEIAETCYREQGLFLPKFPKTYVKIRNPGDCQEIVFNTNGGPFRIQSLLFQKRGILKFHNLWVDEDMRREGLGSKMALATENFAREIGVYDAFALRNAAWEFWDAKGYEIFDENSSLFKMVNDLEMYDMPAYKNLRI